jgi:DNA-binding NarL/FixJ family response regulator
LRVLIVDDHPIVRLGVRQLIEHGWPDAVIDEADTLEAACERAAVGALDIIVLDLVMPGVHGNEGVARMLAVAGSTPILVLSFNAESQNAARLLQMGVAGYLQKDRAAEELVAAIGRVAAGRRYVTESMADHLVGLLGGRTGPSLPHELLSSQEYRVMVLLAGGQSPAAIAQTLGISARTVATYRTRIFEKTGWRGNVDLVKYCVQHGLTSVA